MELGIGLPNAVPGTTGKQLTDFARAADEAGFSTLGTIDRIVYPNFEPLATLAAAAAVTDRIRLGSSEGISPAIAVTMPTLKEAKPSTASRASSAKRRSFRIRRRRGRRASTGRRRRDRTAGV
jgi:hypothetical protein